MLFLRLKRGIKFSAIDDLDDYLDENVDYFMGNYYSHYNLNIPQHRPIIRQRTVIGKLGYRDYNVVSM